MNSSEKHYKIVGTIKNKDSENGIIIYEYSIDNIQGMFNYHSGRFYILTMSEFMNSKLLRLVENLDKINGDEVNVKGCSTNRLFSITQGKNYVFQRMNGYFILDKLVTHQNGEKQTKFVFIELNDVIIRKGIASVEPRILSENMLIATNYYIANAKLVTSEDGTKHLYGINNSFRTIELSSF